MSFELTPNYTNEDGEQIPFSARDIDGETSEEDNLHDPTREISSWLCEVTAKKDNADMVHIGGANHQYFPISRSKTP